jgi:uncharacterized membrane protein YvbJ
MAKICDICGYQSAENATECENCGAPFISVQPETIEKPEKVEEKKKKNPLAGISFPKKFKPEQIAKLLKKYFPAAAIAVAALVLIIIIALASGSGPKKALEKYFTAVEKENVNKYISLMTEGEKKLYNVIDEDALEIEIEDELKNRMDNLEDKYGKKVKFKIKVTDKDEMTTKSLNVIRDAYKLSADLAEVEIKKGIELEFDIVIKGKDEKVEGEGTAYVIKEDGKWKIYEIELNV